MQDDGDGGYAVCGAGRIVASVPGRLTAQTANGCMECADAPERPVPKPPDAPDA